MEECGVVPARTEFLLNSAHYTCDLPTDNPGSLSVSSVYGSDAAVLSDYSAGEPKQFTSCVLGADSSDSDLGACRGAFFLAAHGVHKPKPINKPRRGPNTNSIKALLMRHVPSVMAMAMPATATDSALQTDANDGDVSDAMPATTDDEAIDPVELARRRLAANLLAKEFLRNASLGDSHISHAFAYKVVSAWGCSRNTRRKRLRRSNVSHQNHDTLRWLSVSSGKQTRRHYTSDGCHGHTQTLFAS